MKASQTVLIAVLCILPLKGSSAGTAPRYRLQDVEVHGSDRLSCDAVRAKFDPDIKTYLVKLAGQSKKAAADAEKLKAALEKGVQSMGGFPWVRVDVAKGDERDGTTDVVLMVEVVEEKDMASRMPLRPAPLRDVADTSGLLEAYGRYQDVGWAIFREGKIGLERAGCPAFYCTWGSGTPELKSLETQFVEGVPIYEKLLREVLAEDKDPVKRSRALLLLAYLREGRAVAELATSALLDADAQVRESAMGIFNEMALYHPKVPLPLREIARLFDYPDSGDRGRALAFFVTISSDEDSRSFLFGETADRVLELLRTKHPMNHEAAHRLLCLLSHEKYGDRDYEAWSAWLLKMRKEGAQKGGD
ncbi:MAG: hypothetical protein WC728_02880 [Elusimicrobiota bacterium]